MDNELTRKHYIQLLNVWTDQHHSNPNDTLPLLVELKEEGLISIEKIEGNWIPKVTEKGTEACNDILTRASLIPETKVVKPEDSRPKSSNFLNLYGRGWRR